MPGIILSAGMLVLPESPRWLAGHGRMRDAEAVLHQLRGAADVSGELNTLRTDLAREGRQLASAWELLAPRLRRPLIIGIGLAMFQQITGINTVIYFAPTIFQSAGLSSAATSILATAGVGAVNVIMTIVSIRLIDRLGRRQLLFWSLGGMAVTLFVLAGAFHVGASGQLGWVAVVSVAAYVGFFAIGLGPVFWLLIAEIFPLDLRGRAMSLATVANWGFNLIVSATFLDLVGARRQRRRVPGLRRLSSRRWCSSAMVPETKGRSLEQIEDALEGGQALQPPHNRRARDETPRSPGAVVWLWRRRPRPRRPHGGAAPGSALTPPGTGIAAPAYVAPRPSSRRVSPKPWRCSKGWRPAATGRAPVRRSRRGPHRSREPGHLSAARCHGGVRRQCQRRHQTGGDLGKPGGFRGGYRLAAPGRDHRPLHPRHLRQPLGRQR